MSGVSQMLKNLMGVLVWDWGVYIVWEAQPPLTCSPCPCPGLSELRIPLSNYLELDRSPQGLRPPHLASNVRPRLPPPAPSHHTACSFLSLALMSQSRDRGIF